MREGKTLFAKLAKVLGEVDRVEKRGYNEFHKYAYVLESDLSDAVRAKLAAENVFVFFSVVDVVRDPVGDKGKVLTTVIAEFTFADGDSGETHSVRAAGTGEDASDKGVAKAMTMASKYFLLRNFLIPTGDDPDEETPKKRTQRGAPAPRDSTPQAPPPLAGGGITAEQNRKMYALANKLKIDAAFMRDAIHGRYSVGSSRDLKAEQASDLIQRLEAIEKGQATVDSLAPSDG